MANQHIHRILLNIANKTHSRSTTGEALRRWKIARKIVTEQHGSSEWPPSRTPLGLSMPKGKNLPPIDHLFSRYKPKSTTTTKGRYHPWKTTTKSRSRSVSSELSGLAAVIHGHFRPWDHHRKIHHSLIHRSGQSKLEMPSPKLPKLPLHSRSLVRRAILPLIVFVTTKSCQRTNHTSDKPGLANPTASTTCHDTDLIWRIVCKLQCNVPKNL